MSGLEESKVGQWVMIDSPGYDHPITGCVFDRDHRAAMGMPIGTIDTGMFSLESSGLAGLVSMFNSHVPRRGAMNVPLMGLSVDQKTWVLTTGQCSGEKGGNENFDVPNPDRIRMESPPDIEIEGCQLAENIHYHGHYPIVDMTYELKDCPIECHTRAYSVFIPGDHEKSILPGAIFEMTLCNSRDVSINDARVAFSFFGPSMAEMFANQPNSWERISTPVTGVHVTSERSSYVLGVIGEDDDHVHVGDQLNPGSASTAPGSAHAGREKAWANLHKGLPAPVERTAASSIAVDVSLAPGETKIVRFALAWHSPRWMSAGRPGLGPRSFRHMYDTVYPSALEAAEVLANEHEDILRRTIAWQSVIYAEDSLPGWLQDTLINSLYNYATNSFWAAAEEPIGDWCKPEDGLFGLIESPRHCPTINCIPTTWWGTPPLEYMFPKIALSALRGQKAYQREDGAPAWGYGGYCCWSGPCEMASPTIGYQVSTNVPCVVDMLDRYRQVYGDQSYEAEFYPVLKKLVEFGIDLNRGEDGIVSMPDRTVSVWEFPYETEIWEWVYSTGINVHVGGMKLASVRIAKQWADRQGDSTFADQCDQWYEQGIASLEKAWRDDHYAAAYEPESGIEIDNIFSVALDGQWQAKLAGADPVFPQDRAKSMLRRISETCVEMSPIGALHQVTASGEMTGGAKEPGKEGRWSYPSEEIYPCSPFHVGMAYMAEGDNEMGLEIIRQLMQSYTSEQGLTWFGPCSVSGIDGRHMVGSEYSMLCFSWLLPAMLKGQTFAGPAEEGGLVHRILQAAR